MHFCEQYSEQPLEMLPIYTGLSQIYDDIQGELCSKQSTLFNRLKNKFASLYSQLAPSHYVIVNQILSLSGFAYSKTLTGQQIKMATENGIISLVKKTYLGEKIFVNGLLENQLVYQAKGSLANLKIQKEDNQKAQIVHDAQKVIALANDSLSINKLCGGIILIHNTINEQAQHYREKALLAVYISVLIINDQLGQMSLCSIYEKLEQSKIFSPDFLEAQFSPFQKGEFLITSSVDNEDQNSRPTSFQSLKISNKQKMLFFDMNLTSEELGDRRKNQEQIERRIRNNQMSKLNLMAESVQSSIHQFKENSSTLFSVIHSLNSLLKQSFEDLSSIPKLIQDEILEIVSLLDRKPEDCILQDGYLVFSFKPHEIHEKIRILRKFMKKENQENPEILTRRFSPQTGIQSSIYSSAPSLALAILNPQNQMWFK